MRNVSGAAVLLPTGTGYSFIQLIVMMISLWAVGFANGTFELGVKNGILADHCKASVSKLALAPALLPIKTSGLQHARELASAYVASAYCARTINGIYGDGVVTGLIPPYIAINIGGTPDRVSALSQASKTRIYEFNDRKPCRIHGGGVLFAVLLICTSIC